MLTVLLALATAGPDVAAPPIDVDRRWQVLAAADAPERWRDGLREAGEKLGDWTIDVAGVSVDGPYLVALAEASPDEPILRVVRERLRRPVDLPDFLYLLDDVLVAGRARRGEAFWLSAGRLRAVGAFVHPDDVFDDDPRLYPRGKELYVDIPRPKEVLEPAADGDLLGPRWAARYLDPSDEAEQWRALALASPTGFADRMRLLVDQLRAQGADVWLTSTVRRRERGYLMWGAWLLSRADDAGDVRRAVRRLVARNEDWSLNVPIVWAHPDGWRATRDAARAMAETYDVVYATEAGARESHHYDGVAADVVVLGLPRQVELVAPSGARAWFALLDPAEPRDLSLTPRMIEWIEANFGLHKLEDDYPHWDDASVAE